MDKIVQLVPADRGRINPQLVKTLEDLLEQARSGQILSMGFALVRPGDVVASGWERLDGHNHSISAAINLLAHRYNHSVYAGDI